MVFDNKTGLRSLKLPAEAYLQKDERGLFCRLTLPPEGSSVSGDGVILFPDRRCEGKLCRGPAVITKVIEKESCVFFFGYMKRFSLPDEEKLADYICDHRLWNERLYFMSGKFGKYVVLGGRQEKAVSGRRFPANLSELRLLAQGEENSVGSYSGSIVEDDLEAAVCREVYAGDYICEVYHKCHLCDIMERFHAFHNRKVSGAVRSSMYISDLFSDAVESGFFRLLTYSGICYVELDLQALVRSLNLYSASEINELLTIANKINNKANAAAEGRR